MIKIIAALVLLTNIVAASTYVIPSQKLGTSAKNLVLGNSLFSEKTNGMFNNDARLKPSFSFQGFFTDILEDNQVIIGSILIPIKHVSVGLGYADQSINGLQKSSKKALSGQHFYTGETYGYSNKQLKLSISYLFDQKISLGSGLNYYYTQLDTLIGKGFGLDFGLKYKLSNKTKIAMSAINVLTKDIKYTSYSESVPMSFELGLYSILTKRTHLSISAKRVTKEEEVISDTQYNVGLIYKLTNQISFLAGVYQRDSITDIHTNYAAGVELTIFPLSLEYGYRKSSYKDNENQHFISASLAI